MPSSGCMDHPQNKIEAANGSFVEMEIDNQRGWPILTRRIQWWCQIWDWIMGRWWTGKRWWRNGRKWMNMDGNDSFQGAISSILIPHLRFLAQCLIRLRAFCRYFHHYSRVDICRDREWKDMGMDGSDGNWTFSSVKTGAFRQFWSRILNFRHID